MDVINSLNAALVVRIADKVVSCGRAFSWHPDVTMEVQRSALFSSGDILSSAYNLPVWDQSSDWWRVYGGQSAEKNCKGECQCEPQLAPRSATQSVEKSDRGTRAPYLVR